MIGRIKGKIVNKSENKILIDVGGLCYEIIVAKSLVSRITSDLGETSGLVIYHYLQMDKNRFIPVMIGFLDELEKDFFEIFISVSGIGPRAAVRAFDKPISLIARAIEEGDVDFLKGLAGIGKQKAKQIVASLQGKVGRFVLLREEEKKEKKVLSLDNKEIVEEAKQILRRLQYGSNEIDLMIKRALAKSAQIDSVENLLNEIYHKMY